MLLLLWLLLLADVGPICAQVCPCLGPRLLLLLDTPLRTLGANARDAGYDSKGDALRRLAGCAPILWGSGSAAEGTWGHARQHRRPKGRREIPGRAPAASAPAGGCDSGRPAVSRCRCRGRRGGSVVGVGVVVGGVAVAHVAHSLA